MSLSLAKVLMSLAVTCPAPVAAAGGRQREAGLGTSVSAADRAVVEQAVTAVGGPAGGDIRSLFARQLRSRGAPVAAGEKGKYWRELRAKPELARTTLYEADSARARQVFKLIRPALTLYGRDWDVAVLEQEAPFVGTFRQCILIVSTGLLRLITDEELVSFAAHELAHECFIEELREADRGHGAAAHQLVELKSDLVAALCCLLLGRDPLALAAGVRRVESYYLQHGPSLLGGETHPGAALRRECIELFLRRIRRAPRRSPGPHSASASRRGGVGRSTPGVRL